MSVPLTNGGVEPDGGAARAWWIDWMSREDRYVAIQRPTAIADRIIAGDRSAD